MVFVLSVLILSVLLPFFNRNIYNISALLQCHIIIVFVFQDFLFLAAYEHMHWIALCCVAVPCLMQSSFFFFFFFFFCIVLLYLFGNPSLNLWLLLTFYVHLQRYLLPVEFFTHVLILRANDGWPSFCFLFLISFLLLLLLLLLLSCSPKLNTRVFHCRYCYDFSAWK